MELDVLTKQQHSRDGDKTMFRTTIGHGSERQKLRKKTPTLYTLVPTTHNGFWNPTAQAKQQNIYIICNVID